MPQPQYTHGHHESVLRSHSVRTAENSAAYLLPLLRPGMSVLDVGCGPGTVTVDLAARVAPGRVLGIDTEDSVLAAARRLVTGTSASGRFVGAAGEKSDPGPVHTPRAASHPASGGSPAGPTVEFRVGDIYDLDIADGSFDVVHAHQVLQHLPDPVGALVEMRRICRPGGVVAVRDADYAAMTWYPRLPALQDWMDLYQRAARANGGEPDAGRRLLGWAHRAGFAEVTASASVWCYASPADRAWWGGLWADRIVASAIAEQAVSQGLASVGDLQAISRGWREWAEDDDGWFAVLNGEVLCRPNSASGWTV